VLAIHSAITIAALRLRISQRHGFSLIDGASDSIGGFLDAIETEFLARDPAWQKKLAAMARE
jgi:hypothetical protein